MQQPSLFLLRWYGLLVGLVLGFLVSFAASAALGSRYLTGTPVLPTVARGLPRRPGSGGTARQATRYGRARKRARQAIAPTR